MDNTKIVKEKGKRGLFYAYNSEGEYVAARAAVKGKVYYCPICGCLMHASNTKKGDRIFARNPYQVHLRQDCTDIENRLVVRSFDGLDPKTFVQHLCHLINKRSDPTEVQPKTPKEKTERHKLSDEDDAVLKSFSRLKQIAESDIKALRPYDKQGAYPVSDYIITYNYAQELFDSPDFVLGTRIVYARYYATYSPENAIVFILFNKKYNDERAGMPGSEERLDTFSVRFRLLFGLKNDFYRVRDLFEKYSEGEDGRSRFRRLHKTQDVLIASTNWEYAGRGNCPTCSDNNKNKCRGCRGMYQTFFTSSNQLYLLPSGD